MKNNIALQLAEICKKHNLKEKAFDSFEKLFHRENENDSDFLRGYKKEEMKIFFGGHQFNIHHHFCTSTIDTKIIFYDSSDVEAGYWDPVGYYVLEADFKGEITDDYFVIEKEKQIDGIDIIKQFSYLFADLPTDYLKRNHLQYNFVSYLSLVGTLFTSKNYEGSGRFIHRAYFNLKETGEEHFEKEFLKKSKSFLKMMKKYLINENIISEKLQSDLLKLDQNNNI